MPAVDHLRNSFAASSDADGVAERFHARNESNQLVVVQKLRATASENSLGGLEWSGSGVLYRLEGGEAVDRIDESHFRITRSGEIIRRVEGEHGVTHHQEHQTPGDR